MCNRPFGMRVIRQGISNRKLGNLLNCRIIDNMNEVTLSDVYELLISSRKLNIKYILLTICLFNFSII